MVWIADVEAVCHFGWLAVAESHRMSGHIFCDLVVAHLGQRVTVQQHADVVRALYRIHPALLPKRGDSPSLDGCVWC